MTLVPGATVRVCELKAKFWMVTFTVAGGWAAGLAARAPRAGASRSNGTAMATSSRPRRGWRAISTFLSQNRHTRPDTDRVLTTLIRSRLHLGAAGLSPAARAPTPRQLPHKDHANSMTYVYADGRVTGLEVKERNHDDADRIAGPDAPVDPRGAAHLARPARALPTGP